MDKRLIKRREVAESLLRTAARHVTAGRLAAFEQFMAHKQFALAMDELEAVGESLVASADFWWAMKKAAEVMEQPDRRRDFQRKYQIARLHKAMP